MGVLVRRRFYGGRALHEGHGAGAQKGVAVVEGVGAGGVHRLGVRLHPFIYGVGGAREGAEGVLAAVDVEGDHVCARLTGILPIRPPRHAVLHWITPPYPFDVNGLLGLDM